MEKEKIIYRQMNNGVTVIPFHESGKIRFLVYRSKDIHIPGLGWVYEFSHETVKEYPSCSHVE